MSKISSKLIVAATVYAIASIYLKNKDDDDNAHYSIHDSLESASTKLEQYSAEITEAVEKKLNKLNVKDIKEKVNNVSEKATNVINDIAKAQQTVSEKILEKVESTITKNEEVSDNSGPIVQVVAETTSENPVIKENNDNLAVLEQPKVVKESNENITTLEQTKIVEEPVKEVKVVIKEKPKQKKEKVEKKEEIKYSPRDEFDISPFINILLENKTIVPIKEKEIAGNINDLIKNFESNSSQKENEVIEEVETKIVEEKEVYTPIVDPTLTLQDYIDRYQDLSEKKVTSIYNNVINMTSTFNESTYVTLIHIVQFAKRKEQSSYVEQLSKEYEVTTHDNEAYVVITVETHPQILVSHILDFASQANEFNGTYRGWKVDSTF